ncbi:hypothetical protein BH11PSE9_BH11PSE9_31020 [soil metagenome]
MVVTGTSHNPASHHNRGTIVTTTYQCKGCERIFEGADPIQLAPGNTVYPKCPAVNEFDEQARAGVDYNDYGSWLAAQTAIDDFSRGHLVGLSVVTTAAASKPLGVWGAPNKAALVADTPEQAKARAAQAKVDAYNAARRREAEQIDTDARKLMQRMETAFASGGGGKSANFPKDLEYGTKDNGSQVSAPEAVILRAGALWGAQGARYNYRAPACKKLWHVRMANFEKLIVAGDASGGKHKFHVVPS